MGIFLLGVLIGIIIGCMIDSYIIVDMNQKDPDKFDRMIAELRKELKSLDE